MFTDTHCHLHDPKIADVRTVVGEALNAGVDKIINMGCCLETSMTGKELAESFKSVYFAAGYHPSDADKFSPDTADKIKELTLHEKCVAIGEIGLDRYWKENPDIEIQKKCFVSQLEIAKECKLPVSIHCRDATEIMLNILKSNKDKLLYGGVMHCFAGSKETARELLNLGLYISFGGTLTFKNAANLLEVAEFASLERCLTETDSPYLAPHPLRGTVNQPKNVVLVAEKLAALKNKSTAEIAEIVRQNSLRLFKKLA